MKKNFFFERVSRSGKPYAVKYSAIVNHGFVEIHDCEFSLREIFRENREEWYLFLTEAMAKYGYHLRKEGNRENHGRPTSPVNRGGVYYDVDRKLYRADKKLNGVSWKAPISDVYRIIDALRKGADDTYSVVVEEI